MDKKDMYKLIETLIDSDFLMMDQKFNSTVKLNKNYRVFNAYEIAKNIKELARSLIFLKNNSNYEIIIYVENNFNKSLLDLFFKSKKENFNVNVITSLRSMKKISNKNQILIVLGEIEDNILKNIILDNTYLIHIINEKASQTVGGSYNMQNNVSSMKKLIFLVTLITTMIKQYKDA